MFKNITLRQISEFFFLFALFLICFEPAIFVNHAYDPIFVKMVILAYITGFFLVIKNPKEELKNFFLSLENAFRNFYPLIPLILYIIFDLYSLNWTNNEAYIINKYPTTVPLIFLLLYAFGYFYDERIGSKERFMRGQRVVFALALAAFVLALIIHFHLLVYGRTYFILRTSLQFNYNRFAQSLMLGYFCGVYLISRIENNNKYLLFILFSAMILPLMFTSGSRRFIIMYLPAFLFISLPFIIEGVEKVRKNALPLVLTIVSIALILVFNFYAIDSFMEKSALVYDEMRSDLENEGEDYPSAMDRAYPGIVHPFRKEQPLSRVQGTIESGRAANQRAVIFEIVTNRLESFSQIEWIRGAGGSEQYDIFQTDYAKKIMEENDIDAIAHPHSFVFIDLLNGGIIKLSLTILMIIGTIILCFKFLPHNYKEFFFVGAYGLVYIANELINSSWGLQENRLTWAFFIILIGLGEIYQKRKDKGDKEDL